jgi:signal transduction histidine kinase
MSSDPDHAPRPPGLEPAAPRPGPEDPAKTRFARQILAFVACIGLAALAEGLYKSVTLGLWQFFAITGICAGFVAAVLHAHYTTRRGPSGPAIERVFGFIALTILLVPLWFEQVETMLAAAYIFFILVAAPRLLPLQRADRWVYIACFTGILCSAAELLPLPTRLPPALQYDLPFELTVIVAMVCFALLAFRDSRRFPLRSKLVLAFLVVALGPLAIISYDASTKVVASQQLRDRDDLADGTAATAHLWTSWFAHQRQRLATVVDGADMADACSGDPVELERVRARMQPLLDDLRGAALWSGDGRRLLSVGIPPERPLAPHATVGHGPDGGLVLATPACDGGSLGVALQGGSIDVWTTAAAQRHKAAVLVRDAGGALLAGQAEPALLAALPGLKDLSPETFSLDRSLVALTAPARPRVLQHSGQLIAVAAIEPAGWTLAFLRDESSLRAAIATQKREVHVFTLLAAMFASVAALLLGHALAAPLRRLSAALTRFSAGETSVRADVGSQDEIGGLAEQFNRMAEQVGGLLHSLAQQTQRLQAEVGVRAAQEERLQILNTDLSAARDQAMAANRAKSTFLAHMSHELRTPLNAIIGYGELIEDICEERRFKDIADDTRNIVRSAHHLLTIINDILDLSKIEAGKLDMFVDEFDVGDLVREVAETIAPMISDNKNTLNVRVDAADTHMRSDRTKLRQTLLNLLSNAAKFTEKGNIELRLTHETVAGVPCHIFRVADQGVGIPEGALATLFDPFTQVVYPQVRKRAGTGLGLAITRRLCWMMGGEIDVESISGKGSTFTVWIPSVYRNLGSSESWRPLRNKRAPGQLSGPLPASKLPPTGRRDTPV